ncbi:MAG: hypothetical protein IRY93_08375, partial [Chthoniobacterales bacterium]|nr:hypothetical protein [Chthoniobacterales bacterium]
MLLNSGTGFVVGDGGTILKTTDAGATWAPLASGTSSALYDVYFFDSTGGVAVGEQGLILRTTDGGADWQSVISGVSDSLRSISFSGSAGICAGDSQDILYSTDGGASWQIGQSGFFGGGFPGAQMLGATTGLVAGQNSIFQALLGSTTDGGVTWNFQPFYFDGNEGGCNDLFFFDGTNGLVSGTIFDGRGAIARTTDGGLTWSTTLYDQAIEGLSFPTATSGFAAGAAGRILHSTDMGTTWSDQISGTAANLHDVAFASDALRGIAVGDGGVILRTTNGGASSGWLELQKISSSDGATDDQFGWSVGLAAADTAFVGAPNHAVNGNVAQGAVYVFTRSGNTWSETQTITAGDGAEGDSFGQSLAFDQDTNTLIVGAPNKNGFQGAAYIFTESGGSWTQAQKIEANDAATFAQFGWSVAIEGNTAMVGSIGANVPPTNSVGAVYVFTQSGGLWSQAQKFSSSDGASGDGFGWSLALGGGTVVVGANTASPNGLDFAGAAYVFNQQTAGTQRTAVSKGGQRPTGVVWTQTQKLTASNGAEFDFFGGAVALVGNTALIGAEGAGSDPFSNQGLVYVFTNSGGSWIEGQQIAASDGQGNDGFGHAIAFDGSKALITAAGATVNGNDTAGAAYVFRNKPR